MDRFQQLTSFVEVARRQSFARAAEQLGVNVSAVSRAVAALETRLGVRLLQRTTRRVALSEAGRVHFARCEALLAELESAEATVSESAGTLRGTLRVSAPSGFGHTHVVPIVPEFSARHAHLTLDLQLSNRYVDLIEEGFDLAIRVGTLEDSRLVARRLAPSRRVLVASSVYLQAHGRPRQPRQLAAHACLVLDIGPYPEQWELVKKNAKAVLRATGPLRCNNALALRDVCRAGLGIALLPQFAVAADLKRGDLKLVLPGWSTPEHGIYAVYPSYRFIPAKVRAFVDCVEQRLRGRGGDS